jgi:hypothetical protein
MRYAFGDILLDLLSDFRLSLGHIESSQSFESKSAQLFLCGSDSLTWALTSTGVGSGTLPPDRQATAMPNSPITTEIHQSLDAHRHFTTKISLHAKLANFFAQPIHFCIGKILDLRRTFYFCGITYLLRTCTADSIDGRQRDLGVLLVWNIDACDTGHMSTYFSSLK